MLLSHVLGQVGLLGLSLLPGIGLVDRAGGGWWSRLGLACTYSLALNCFVLMWLFMLGIYSPLTAWAWLLILIGTTVWLRYRSTARRPPERRRGGRLGLLLAPLFAIVAWKALTLPFFTYDGAASWNRWARDYVLDPAHMLDFRFFYTQYHSLTLSFPYMLSGDTGIEYYSHGLALVHVIVLATGLALLSRLLGAPAPLAIAGVFVTLPVFRFSGTGYADVAAAGFAVMAVACFTSALGDGLAGRRSALLAGAFAGTAYLFKQSVLPAVVLVPVLALLLPHAVPRRRRFWLGAMMAGAMGAVVLPWYVVGDNLLVSDQLTFVVSGIHGDATRGQIASQGLQSLIGLATAWKAPRVDWLVLISVAVLTLVGSIGRRSAAAAIALAGFVSLLVWMATANYDSRGALPGVVLIGVVAASGLGVLTERLAAPRVGRLVTGLLTGLFVLSTVTAELDLCERVGRKCTPDWREGDNWYEVGLTDGRDQKLGRLNPNLEGLAAWRRKHPRPTRRIWGEPIVIGTVDPYSSSRRHRWIDTIDSDGRLRWESGDFLLVSRYFLDRPKRSWRQSHPLETGVTWKEWIERQIAAGALTPDGQYGIMTAYRVTGQPPG